MCVEGSSMGLSWNDSLQGAVCAMAVAVVRTQCLLHILLRDVGEGFKDFVDTLRTRGIQR